MGGVGGESTKQRVLTQEISDCIPSPVCGGKVRHEKEIMRFKSALTYSLFITVTQLINLKGPCEVFDLYLHSVINVRQEIETC